MNTGTQQIYNWITTGVQQPADRIQELFYFDSRDKEFFSILITDYFLFDEDLNVDKKVASAYSLESLEKLADKLRRIESESPGIIALPRLGDSKQEREEEFFLSAADSFLNLNAIDIGNVEIWIPGESGSITIKLTDDVVNERKRPWWKFW